MIAAVPIPKFDTQLQHNGDSSIDGIVMKAVLLRGTAQVLSIDETIRRIEAIYRIVSIRPCFDAEYNDRLYASILDSDRFQNLLRDPIMRSKFDRLFRLRSDSRYCVIQDKGKADSPMVSCLIYAESNAEQVSAEDKMLTVEIATHQSVDTFNSMERDLSCLLGYTVDC